VNNGRFGEEPEPRLSPTLEAKLSLGLTILPSLLLRADEVMQQTFGMSAPGR